MARKDVFAGALASLMNTEGGTSPRSGAGKSILHSSALGAVETGLARGLQLTELDPGLVHESEFADRLPYGEADLQDLIESIRQNGQQIPILVQREATDQYRVVYGRRRLAAARSLGIKVRALVTQLDDAERIIAQGVENTVRTDLSFIEKAMFAHRLRSGGIDEATIRQALNIDVGAPKATTISSMKMVVEALGEPLILSIGRAPGIGRPRWRALAELLRERETEFAAANPAAIIDHLAAEPLKAHPDLDASDQRFARAFAYLKALSAPARPAPAPRLAEIKRSRTAVTLTFRRESNPEFHAWVAAQAESLLDDLQKRWEDEQTSQPAKEAR